MTKNRTTQCSSPIERVVRHGLRTTLGVLMAVMASCSSAHATGPKAAPTTAHTTAPMAAQPSQTANTTATTTTASPTPSDPNQPIIDAYRSGWATYVALAENRVGVPVDPSLAQYFADPMLQGFRQTLAMLREHGLVFKGTYALSGLAVTSNDGTKAHLHDCNTNDLDQYTVAGTQVTHTGLGKLSEELDAVKGADGKWRIQAIFSTINGPHCA